MTRDSDIKTDYVQYEIRTMTLQESPNVEEESFPHINYLIGDTVPTRCWEKKNLISFCFQSKKKKKCMFKVWMLIRLLYIIEPILIRICLPAAAEPYFVGLGVHPNSHSYS